MEYDSTYFQEHRKEIKPQHRNLLMYMYNWIVSDTPPISRMINGKTYYLMNYSHLSDCMKTSYKNIQNHINRLCGDKMNPVRYISKKIVRINPKYVQSWIFIDFDIMKLCVKDYDEIIKPRRNKVEELFTIDNGLRYPTQAISIVNLAITRYNKYFSHKIPLSNSRPTKIYTDSIKKVVDIYNGTFVSNRRLYAFSDDFVNNKSFSIKGWKNRLLEVKGNWNKTKRLILEALANFELMHDPSMMPYRKDYLKENFSEWLYDGWNGEGQSQFVQCLKRPEKIREHNGELKADRIYDGLPSNVQKAGNLFFDMNPNMNSARLWENVEKMYEWSKSLFKNERSSTYICGSASELPLKYADFLKENEVKVNIYALDIEYCVNVDGPWSWFVQDLVRKHGLHMYLATCKNGEAIDNLYSRDNRQIVNF